MLSDPPGSSAWFDRAIVAYGNSAKTQLLGLSDALLRDHGAVSAAAVTAMARTLLETSDASLALAVSGIAGPGGGSAEKPVGTVWMGWLSRHRAPGTQDFLFAGDRDAVRRQTVAAALDLIERELSPT